MPVPFYYYTSRQLAESSETSEPLLVWLEVASETLPTASITIANETLPTCLVVSDTLLTGEVTVADSSQIYVMALAEVHMSASLAIAGAPIANLLMPVANDLTCAAIFATTSSLSLAVELFPGELVAESITRSSVWLDCVDDPVWSGYLTVGSLTALAELLPADSTWTGRLKVEPCNIRNIGDHYIRSINIANADRTRVSPTICHACPPLIPISRDIWVRGTCYTGDIRFLPGYNCRVELDANANAITIEAAVGEGQGEPCEEVVRYATETAIGGHTLLDSSPACNEVVRSLNGLGGPLVPITAGTGITVIPHAETNSITIAVDLHNVTVCAAEAES